MINEYPEHEKLLKVAELSQSIGKFLDWVKVLENEKRTMLDAMREQNDAASQ